MFIKIRRDTLIILILAFVLILSGRAMSYVAFASSNSTDEGIPIAGVMIKGNDIIPTSTIKANVESAGFRDGSYINGNTLITSQRQLLLEDAKNNAEQMVKKSTIPGTSIAPINAVDVQVDENTGNVVVTVVEDFSILQTNATNTTNSSLNYEGTSESG
ncbi:hypothetical protein [Methanosphaera sp. WGK6]|uniref:hypothetical protein n=1 Tax=Methanosphaera sp. WGK6 TaxID=1561964 RepID=UPI00084C4F83|nr:hypothetical protein [Methanosphaera sp. WGK6]OED30713.1 membrane protein [Methanosphaera sp. WGK6]